MPTAWTETGPTATAYTRRTGLGRTWFGDWRRLQDYSWTDLQAFTWAQLASSDDYTKTPATAAAWTATTRTTAWTEA